MPSRTPNRSSSLSNKTNTSPYDILELPKTATLAQITKAYRQLSLKYHPDKNLSFKDGKEEKPTDTVDTTLTFHKINAAYNLLRDEEKRSIFDSTGKVPDVEDDLFGNSNCNQKQNAQAKLDPETLSNEIEDFYKSYKGSPEEKEDIIDSYKKTEGSFSKMMLNYLIFNENDSEKEIYRILSLVKSFIDCGDISKRTRFFSDSTTHDELDKLKKQLAARAAKNKKIKTSKKLSSSPKRNLISVNNEDNENLKNNKKGGKRTREQIELMQQKENDNEKELQSLILSRKEQHKAEFDANLKDIENRYVNKTKSPKKK